MRAYDRVREMQAIKTRILEIIKAKSLFNSFCIGWVIFGLIFGVFIGLGISTSEKRSSVYVDMDKVISAVVKELVASKEVEDIEVRKSRIEKYKSKFAREIEEYSKAQGVIIFSSPKPIAGAVDKTEYFIKRILVRGREK